MKRIINIMICLIVLSLSGCILVNPKTLDYGSDETTKTFTLTVIGNVEWSIAPSESWIAVDPDSGQSTDTITVTVDRTGLDDGSYEAVLNVTTNPDISCPDVIVKMTVVEVTTSTTTSRRAGDSCHSDGACGPDYCCCFNPGWGISICVPFEDCYESCPPLGGCRCLYGDWGSSGKDVFAVGSHGTILHYDGDGIGDVCPTEEIFGED